MTTLANFRELTVRHNGLIDVEQKSEILDFPLIAPYNTGKNLAAAELRGGNIYFGTGVATPKAITRGLPLDFLGMLLAAKWVCQRTNAKGIIHEISDSHTLASSLYNPEEIDRIARQQREQVTQLVSALGMQDSYTCVLASEYRQTDAFRDIQDEINDLSPDGTPLYVRYQSAGNLYFARYKEVECKIGWLVDDTDKPTGFDERKFNFAYNELGVQPIIFVYTWNGWNFDATRSRVVPYTSLQGERRLMLSDREPAIDQLQKYMDECTNEKVSRSVIIHLARIFTAYDIVFKTTGKNFWANGEDSTNLDAKRLIEISKPAPWAAGQYVDVSALAQRIDEFRVLQNLASDAVAKVAHGRLARRAEARAQTMPAQAL